MTAPLPPTSLKLYNNKKTREFAISMKIAIICIVFCIIFFQNQITSSAESPPDKTKVVVQEYEYNSLEEIPQDFSRDQLSSPEKDRELLEKGALNPNPNNENDEETESSDETNLLDKNTFSHSLKNKIHGYEESDSAMVNKRIRVNQKINSPMDRTTIKRDIKLQSSKPTLKNQNISSNLATPSNINKIRITDQQVDSTRKTMNTRVTGTNPTTDAQRSRTVNLRQPQTRSNTSTRSTQR